MAGNMAGPKGLPLWWSALESYYAPFSSSARLFPDNELPRCLGCGPDAVISDEFRVGSPRLAPRAPNFTPTPWPSVTCFSLRSRRFGARERPRSLDDG